MSETETPDRNLPARRPGQRPTRGETETRRQQVLRLRAVFRLSTAQITEALARLNPPILVDESTVSRDLQHIKRHFREQLSPENFDPEGEVSAVLETFDYIQGQALREYRTIPASGSARAKMTCLRTAADAAERKINLLQDLGLVTRELGTLRLGQAGHVEDADAIRQWLDRNGNVVEGELVPDAERAWLYGDAAAAPALDADETVPEAERHGLADDE